VGNKAGEGRAYGNLGNCYHSLADFKLAIEYHQRDLNIAIELGYKAGVARAKCNLGNAFHSLGNFKQAIECHKEGLAIDKDLGDRAGEGRSYSNIGIAYSGLGDFKEALEYLEKYLFIASEVGDKAGEGGAYGNLGCIYRNLGNFKQAIGCHKQCLSISQEIGDKAQEGRAYENLGAAYNSLGNFDLAIWYQKKALCRASELEDRAGEGRANCNLGLAYQNKGEFDKAAEHQRENLRISNDIEDRAGQGIAYGNLGNIYHSLGDFRKAIEYHSLHLGIAREVEDRAGEGTCYGNVGNAFFRLGDYNRAVEYHRQLLAIADETGNAVEQARAYYSLGRDFEVLPSLCEALKCYRSSVKVYNEIRALLQSEDQWKISFRNRNEDAYSALWRTLLKNGDIEEALYAAEQGRAQGLIDLLKLQYGFTMLPSVSSQLVEASISDILRDISTQTVFLALQGDTINFWVLNKGHEVTFRQKEVEDGCAMDDAATYVQDLKNAFQENELGRGAAKCEDRSLDGLRGDDDQQFEKQALDSSHCDGNSLRQLHDFVVGPIKDLLQGEEVIIVPDGPLGLAPYAAFVDPADSRYLSESLRIRILPSLTTIKLIAESPESFHETSGALLVGDPNLKEITKGGKPILAQLPYARDEITMIGEILNTTPLTGAEATKQEVLKRMTSVSLVHIATHGNAESGDLALAPNPGWTSKIPKKADYMLTMDEVQADQLTAKLVVLSCCHSGKGKITAEGVVGIARAFIGAGARSVLVSLWAIDDEATMEFMRFFYRQLRDGESACLALDQAMKCLRNSERFSAVKYWAPFVLIGDDVAFQFGELKE